MPTYRVLEQFYRGGEMHEIHHLWEATEEEAAWNLSQKRVEKVVLPYEHLGQKIISEVENVPKRRVRTATHEGADAY